MTSSLGTIRRLFAAGLLLAIFWPVAAEAQNLTAADVTRAIAAAAREANARNQPAVIAVVDRVGNVLGVFRMNNAPARVRVSTFRGIAAGNGLENVQNVFQLHRGRNRWTVGSPAPQNSMSFVDRN